MRRRLGTSGLAVTPLALGTMTWGHGVDRHEAGEHLHAFLEAGGNLVDTAFGYGGGASETMLGELLTDEDLRGDVIVCTKSGISRTGGQRRVDVSRRGLMAQLETSLGRLGTDHVDLGGSRPGSHPAGAVASSFGGQRDPILPRMPLP